ncbi:hypothetical protein AKJ09_09791 [Labilithrix luteola]|uniref:Response regulatory domain-containing protein n=1 Tax=Labilithrix luteola TaxID=1391654 RepID=A0A0K1QBL9_9BACT|nr:hypothetical protein AKJ09_09791 [Labilithrix luteola]
MRCAATAEAAISEMGAHDDWSGFLIDVGLGQWNRAGLDVLAAARRVFPSVPAALVTASNERDIINRAASLSASFLCKPFGPTEIAAFLERVTAAEAGIDERLEGRLSALARRWDLAPKETEILAWLIAGRTRENYLVRSGSTALTWRVHVGRLLKKAGTARTSDLVTAVLRDEARALARRRT